MNHEDNAQINLDNSSLISNDDSVEIKSEINFINFLGYPFNFVQNPEINEDINEQQRYYFYNINNSDNSNDCSSEIVSIPPNKNKFTISHKKKRGRHNEKFLTEQKNFKVHEKSDVDNILRKCQVSYINFIIDFMNILCKIFNIGQVFIPLDYKFKKIVNKKTRNKLISQTIGEIIQNNISPKYTTKDKLINKKICEKIREKGLTDFIDILNKRFLFFFDKIYYPSRRSFNLKQFHLVDIEIKLPDEIELYEDLLDKNRNDRNFEEYKEKMEKGINKYFLPKVNKYFFECH